MIIHRSNRTEVLIRELGALVGGMSQDPFTKETLVVQGRGMERWLSMQLADQLGVWANPEILSLRGLLDMCFKRILDAEPHPGFDPDSLMWSLAEILPGLVKQPGFEPIRRYLERDEDDRKRFQLARQLANTFYQYMTYRPEMIAEWQAEERAKVADPDERWQSTLWRALVERLGPNHLVGRANELVRQLAREDTAIDGLPDRVSIFGLSSLPRLYLDLFSALSNRLELHLFILSPTREYWADIASPKESRRALGQDAGQDATSLHLLESHSLLGSLGELGRDFQQMLEDEGSYIEAETDLYQDPRDEGQSMLRVLQSDMLNLRVRGEARAASSDDPRADADDERLPLDLEDRSIRVHSCHSPMREVEVLREELLACFEALPSLEPRDVVVMTPDIETYAPYIDAVFGVRSHKRDAIAMGEGAIPFRIADRGPQTCDQVALAFRCGLDFVGSRFTAAAALDLLDLDCVREKFGFEAQDLEIVKTWIVESGIRWGVDGAHRESLDQPGNSENTWRFGLDRLLLGYGMPSEPRALFHGVRPLDAVEGQSAERLGRTLDYCEFLFDQREKLALPRHPEQWRDALLGFLADLAQRDDENSEQHLLLRRVLDAIAKQAADAGFAADVSLVSMRAQIDRGLSHARTPSGFLAAGVTFCELVPMRSIPFQVVCLLGLNEDAFPRVRQPRGFDLVAKHPRVGDRTTRSDDRYLFLEALLAARERLVISFVGQSIKDGSALSPSVVVDELLDSLAESFASSGASQAERRSAVRDAVLFEHPRQATSFRYFERGSRFDAHSALYCEAAAQLAKSQQPDSRFIESPLRDLGALGGSVAPAVEAGEAGEVEEEGIDEIDLDQLIAFFRNPARHFVRGRMQIALREDGDELALREPFELDALDRFKLGTQLLDWLGSGASEREAYALAKGSGRLPHGLAGQIAFDDLMHSVVSIATRVQELTDGATTRKASFAIEIAGARLSGELADLAPRGQILSRFAKLEGVGELGAWIRHLVLQVAAADPKAHGFGGSFEFGDIELDTYLIGRPVKSDGRTVVRFAKVEAPKQTLAQLVALFRDGRRAPLPLFPRTSRVYAERTLAGKDREAALRVAKAKFREDRVVAGEGLDPYNVLAFKGVDPLDPGAQLAGEYRFDVLADSVFAPLLTARDELA
jgi:exodeoxyribonuclease V gamma subunit